MSRTITGSDSFVITGGTTDRPAKISSCFPCLPVDKSDSKVSCEVRVGPKKVASTSSTKTESPRAKVPIKNGPDLELALLDLAFPRNLFEDEYPQGQTIQQQQLVNVCDIDDDDDTNNASPTLCRQLYRTPGGHNIGMNFNSNGFSYLDDGNDADGNDGSSQFTGCDVWIATHKEVRCPVDAGKRMWKPFG